MDKKILQHLSKDTPFKRVLASTTIEVVDDDGTVYEALSRSIVSQQLSVKAARTIYERFLALFPDNKPTPDLVLTFDTDSLRAVGLSRQKSGYIQNVARYFKDHQLTQADWQKYSDEEIIEQLTTIKGVGRWTVQMILMFNLKRLDVFPIDDLGVKNAMIQLYQIEEEGKALKTKLSSIAENWRPYRTIACRYLWNWKDAGGL